MGSSSAALASHPPGAAAPAPRRYHTRVGPTPPSRLHPRPSQRAPPSKRARTSGPGECSSSRPQEPQSPPHQSPHGAPHLDLSPASIIRRPLFHYNPIPGNVDCSEKDLHDEVYYDFPSFFEDPELQDLMLLVKRYSLEPFMTPRRFYLLVVLANSTAYRQWPHPSPREMVRLLSGDTTAGTILFRRQLPPRMRLIDHILRSNLFPL